MNRKRLCDALQNLLAFTVRMVVASGGKPGDSPSIQEAHAALNEVRQDVPQDVMEQAMRDRIKQLEDEQVQWGNKLLEALRLTATPESIGLDKILQEVTRLKRVEQAARRVAGRDWGCAGVTEASHRDRIVLMGQLRGEFK